MFKEKKSGLLHKMVYKGSVIGTRLSRTSV